MTFKQLIRPLLFRGDPERMHDSLSRVLEAPYVSGVPGLAFYPRFVQFLETKMPSARLKAATFENIKNAFGMDIERRKTEMNDDLANEYPFDPYQPLG